jgi:hypothetical protein
MSQIKDLKNDLNVVASILPQAVTADAEGAAVDTRGYLSAVLLGSADTALAGSFVLQHSDASGATTFTTVSDDDCVTSDGTNTTAAVAGANITIGYIGTKRYLRAFWDHTTAGDVSASIILGNPMVAPTGANS